MSEHSIPARTRDYKPVGVSIPSDLLARIDAAVASRIASGHMRGPARRARSRWIRTACEWRLGEHEYLPVGPDLLPDPEGE